MVENSYRSRDRRLRTVLKTISWRIIGACLTFVVAWIFTKKVSASLSIVGVREIFGLIFFYAHERVWTEVHWGKIHFPEE